MGISNIKKELPPLPGDDYVPSEDSISVEALEAHNDEMELYYAQKEKRHLQWKEKGEVNLKILRQKQMDAMCAGKSANYIGERIKYLRKINKQSMADLYMSVGVSKSTMHRCESGTHIPSEKNLRKIITGLFVEVADFCYSPDDFEKWKTSFEANSQGENIFSFRDEMLQTLETGNFTYISNGKTVRLPFNYIALLKNLISNSFAILNLLPHDKI